MTASSASVLAGRYQLGDLLGTGGMADVYRAVDLLLGREVAVKLLRSQAGDTSAEARFRSEARLLAAISHPHVITILDVSPTGLTPAYLVMELIDGPSLAQRLREAGPTDAAAMRALGVQLARGLDAAHQRGIMHRDVKPDNVLLRPDGTAILTDFGISRLQDSAHHTAAGMVIGSPAYLAPEQVSGGPLTAAVDIYALGLVLLECYTGARAYPGPAVEAALARLTASPAIPVSLPSDLRDLLVAMTALDPGERPSAEQVALVLAPTDVRTSAPVPFPVDVPTEELCLPTGAVFAEGVPTAATQVTPPLSHRRHRTVFGSVAAVAAVLAIWMGGSLIAPSEGGGGQDRPSDPTVTPVADPPASAVTPSPTPTPKAVTSPKPGEPGTRDVSPTRQQAAGGDQQKAKVPKATKGQDDKGRGKGKG